MWAILQRTAELLTEPFPWEGWQQSKSFVTSIIAFANLITNFLSKALDLSEQRWSCEEVICLAVPTKKYLTSYSIEFWDSWNFDSEVFIVSSPRWTAGPSRIYSLWSTIWSRILQRYGRTRRQLDLVWQCSWTSSKSWFCFCQMNCMKFLFTLNEMSQPFTLSRPGWSSVHWRHEAESGGIVGPLLFIQLLTIQHWLEQSFIWWQRKLNRKTGMLGNTVPHGLMCVSVESFKLDLLFNSNLWQLSLGEPLIKT